MMMQEKLANLGHDLGSENTTQTVKILAVKSLGAAALLEWANGLLHYCHVLYQIQDFDLWARDTERRLEAN